MKTQINTDKIKHGLTQILILSIVYCLLSTVIGCDAFVRKFTRKPKPGSQPREEMVLAPEEYKAPQMPKGELYRQYFLYWKSWHDELIESLLQRKSQKKQIDCVQEAIKNLIGLKELLNQQMQMKLGVYIGQLRNLQEQILSDLYGSSADFSRQAAERIRMNILKHFSFNKVKDSLI